MITSLLGVARCAVAVAVVETLVAAGTAPAGATTITAAGGSTARAVPPAAARSLPSSSAQAWHAVPAGPRRFYGTIVAIKGSLLAIRLRSGRVQAADATVAIAHGDFSAPLFVGKLVSVDGAFHGTTFAVAHVFRLTNLDNLGVDR